MSSKKKIGIVIVVAVLAITFMTVAFLTTQTNTDYYTQIDNRWVTDIAPHGAMNYSEACHRRLLFTVPERLSHERTGTIRLSVRAYCGRGYPHKENGCRPRSRRPCSADV